MSIAVAAGVVVILLLLAGNLFMRPMKWVFKLAFNSVLGFLMLWGINLLGGTFGFTLATNWFNALIAGFLGIPGVILLIVFKYLFAY